MNRTFILIGSGSEMAYRMGENGEAAFPIPRSSAASVDMQWPGGRSSPCTSAVRPRRQAEAFRSGRKATLPRE